MIITLRPSSFSFYIVQ